MNSDEIYDVVIVGGGPAGLTAGLYCMRAALRTVLLEKGVSGGQIAISKDVDNYPGIANVTGFQLAEFISEQAESFGLVILRKEVAAVEPGTVHLLKCSDGEVIRTHAVIVATGGNPNHLNIQGEGAFLGKGVSYCGTCDGFFFRGKTVAVIGGGDTAVEEALFLSRVAKKVFLIHRRDSLRATRILRERLFADPKIEVIWNTVPKEIKGDAASGVTALALGNVVTGEEHDLETDGVFIFIGYSPDTRILPENVLRNDAGYVLADEKLETSIPGVFVAGDLRQKYANQIVIAASDGCTAALAAARYVEAAQFAVEKPTPDRNVGS